MSAFKSTNQEQEDENDNWDKVQSSRILWKRDTKRKRDRRTYNLSERAVKRWAKAHSQDRENGLRSKKTIPKRSPQPYHHHWNNELSSSKRNILNGEPEGLSTNSIFPILGELLIVSLKSMDFSFVLKQNSNLPASVFNVVTLTACGREVLFSFVYGELIRSMSRVLLMTALGIGWRARYTFTKMLLQRLTLFVWHSTLDGFHVKSISIMENNLSPRSSKLKHRKTG